MAKEDDQRASFSILTLPRVAARDMEQGGGEFRIAFVLCMLAAIPPGVEHYRPMTIVLGAGRRLKKRHLRQGEAGEIGELGRESHGMWPDGRILRCD